MAGRIKRRISEQLHEAAQAQQEVIVICPLCTREIPESEMESHHLIPKSKGGRDTEYLHRICVTDRFMRYSPKQSWLDTTNPLKPC